MAKIIAVAQNYAFGPIGKLLTITPYLKKAGHEIHFIGEGTAYQLGSKENFDSILLELYESLAVNFSVPIEHEQIAAASLDNRPKFPHPPQNNAQKTEASI